MGRLRRKDLERALEAVPDHPRPRAELEQYRTPATVAADLLWAALEEGDLDGRVLDLGCGTGMLAIGAALCGARVAGVDVDPEAVAAARQAAGTAGVEERVELQVQDLADWHPQAFDAVVMNPPFGAQRKGADRVFYDRAAEALRPGHGAVWFLAQVRTERFLQAYFRGLGGSLERVLRWQYPLPARFGFHDREVVLVDVGGYRAAF